MIGPDDEDEDDISYEEKLMIEDEFFKLYTEDSRFRMVLGGAKPEEISIRDKYELIIAYTKREEEEGEGPPGSENAVKVEGEFVIYKGKRYKRVKLDNDEEGGGADDDEEYLMDSDGNIYDT